VIKEGVMTLNKGGVNQDWKNFFFSQNGGETLEQNAQRGSGDTIPGNAEGQIG